jgi:hypothetical protein
LIGVTAGAIVSGVSSGIKIQSKQQALKLEIKVK